MASQGVVCPSCNEMTPNLEGHLKNFCPVRLVAADGVKFGFKHGGSTYSGPGYFFLHEPLVTQDAMDVCWNAALVNSLNATLGTPLLAKRDVAKLCHTDLYKHKGLQPHEFEEAANLVVNSDWCPSKITVIAKRWKKDVDAQALLIESLKKGDGAMISVDDNAHVQVVLGYCNTTGEILLYDTADNAFQAVTLDFIAKHKTTEWVYMFAT